MPIQFPSSPTVGQQTTTGGKTYQWNGRFWKVVSSGTGGGGGDSSWEALPDKPTEFPPSAHTHSVGSVTGLTGALDSLATDIAGKQPSGPYLTSESDPVFAASAAAGISSQNIANWSTAYGWGNHASAGYQAALVSGTNIKTVNGQPILGAGNLTVSGGANYAVSETAPNPATSPIWFDLSGKQHIWDGEAWFEVPGTPGADGVDGVNGADGADGADGTAGSPILSWMI